MKGIEVAIFMVTYNHSAYIRQALDSILLQVTSFNFKIFVGEDCSTDNTRKILIEYKNKFPEKIEVLFHSSNVGSTLNAMSIYKKCYESGAKYIAMCEGDDYWTDSLKLQKQVDFLNANEEFSMSCHSSDEIDQNGNVFKVATRPESTIDLSIVLQEGWFIRTATIIFRRTALNSWFPDFYYNAYSADYILQVIILKSGKCKYFHEVMSAYRHHIGGISQANQKIQVERWLTKIKLLDKLNEFTGKVFKEQIKVQQQGIKKSISYYLFRYPILILKLGLRFYLKHANLFFMFQEFKKRILLFLKNLCFYFVLI